MHKIIKCSCGEIITQCRCINPNKIIEVWEDGCVECQKKIKAQKKNDDNIYIPEPTD